jgi:hypothetical protein
MLAPHMEPLVGESANASIARLSDETTHQLTTYDNNTWTKTLHVARGGTVTVGEVRGAGTIHTLWLTFPGWFWAHWAPDDPVSQSILKNMVLRLYWDDSPNPAVEAPIGDFFGNGLCEVRSFASKYFGMSSGGFFCRFPMPFRTGFRCEIENRDPEIDTVVFANLLYQQVEELSDTLAYFHCRFRTGFTDGTAPIEVVNVEGRGHWAGLALAMQCKARNRLHFLEAPERVYIDDDWESPRFTGTGMEDYFLGGWYFREGESVGPLHGVPLKDPFNSSVAMYRVHETDAVRFRRRLRWEFFHPHDAGRNVDTTVAWSSAAYLYLDTPDGPVGHIGGPDELMCWYRVKDCDHASVP